MGGARGYNGKRNKPLRERQTPYNFTYMRKLKDKSNGGKKRDSPQNTPLTTENKHKVEEVGEIGEFSEGD